MLSFLFLQSEFSTEDTQKSRSFLVENEWFKNILKKIKKYFVSSKKVFTFALANKNGSGF